MLSPGDTYTETYNTEVNRCEKSENEVSVFATATNPDTGLPKDCSDEDELRFGWDVVPTPAPTPPPTPPPTPAPSPFPSSAPTGECIIDTMVECTGIIDGREIDCEDITAIIAGTENCIVPLTYDVKVSNTGSTEEQVYKWDLTVNGEEIDLLQAVPGGELMLSPGDTYTETYNTEVNRCEKSENEVSVFATATNPDTGLPKDCLDEDELRFGWDVVPTPAPTPPPTPPPTPAPSPFPSSAPTGECIIDTMVECTGIIDGREIDCEDITAIIAGTENCIVPLTYDVKVSNTGVPKNKYTN